MQCGKCGAQVGDDFKFCPECGTPMPVVRKAAEKVLDKGEEFTDKVKEEATEKITEAKAIVEEAAEEVREKASDIKDQAADAVDKVKDQAADVVDKVKDQAADAVDKAKDKVSETAEKLKDQVKDATDSVKGAKEAVEDKVSDVKESVEDKVEKVKKDVAEIEENAKQAVKKESEKVDNKMENPVKQKVEEPVDKKAAQDKRKIKDFIWCMAVLAVAVLIACMAQANKTVPVELDNFVTISYEGYDTEGTAKAHFDKKAFLADYGETIENAEGLIADCIDGELSKTEGLSNGDEVVYQWNCDAEAAAADYKAELSFNDITDTVSGLEELPDTTGMIFPDSDTERLVNADVEGMEIDELKSALNEIYARHGYIFHNEDTQKEFEEYSWYEPTIDADDWVGEDELNRIELYNVEFLKNHIKDLKEAAAK